MVLPLFTRQVDLGGESAAGSAERVIGRFGPPSATWRFFLRGAVTAGTGRVLMRATDGGIHVDLPADQPGGIGSGLQPGQDLCPDAFALPAAKQAVHGLPGAVGGGHVPPRDAGAYPPSDPVDKPAFRPHGRTTTSGRVREHRLQYLPLLIGQIPAHAAIIAARSNTKINL